MLKILKESECADHLPEAITDQRYYLFCPGCYQEAQRIYPDEPRFWINYALHCFSAAVHQFNGDRERPTLSPSLLCKGESKVCHSYVQEGRIQYLSDCTHPLANQTVELMDAQLYLDQYPVRSRTEPTVEG